MTARSIDIFDDQGYIYGMVYIEPWGIDEIAQEYGAVSPSTTALTRPLIDDSDVVQELAVTQDNA